MTPNDSVQMRACVLREPGAVATETVSLAAPRAGEVRVRIAAAGVCHSDLHLADGKLGDGRWPIVLGHEGAGVVDAVGDGVEHLTPGDHVVLAMVVPCGQCESCRVGHRTLCEPAGAHGFAGVLADGSSRLTDGDGRELQHCFSVACFAEHAVVGEQAAIPIPANLPLWQASLLGCGAVTGFGAVNHAARVGIGERVCVVGCGGVGMQAIAAARLAGAAQIIAVDLRAEKLDHALRRGATHTVLAASDDPAGQIRSLSGGGVDHAFEVVGAPATIRLAWDALRPGGTAVVVGLAPVGVEVALPAIEFLSEKRIVGSYYGSADPALSLRGLVDLAAAGRLPLDDMVSHFIELDQVPEAFERLRHGEGDRSVIVVDPELAGVPATQDRTTHFDRQ
ncbi:MAG: alcohol dehydrogenase catalytic domain-containing protein [Solirubrobacteraceae bacterium]